jgi:hypothetical protein
MGTQYLTATQHPIQCYPKLDIGSSVGTLVLDTFVRAGTVRRDRPRGDTDVASRFDGYRAFLAGYVICCQSDKYTLTVAQIGGRGLARNSSWPNPRDYWYWQDRRDWTRI